MIHVETRVKGMAEVKDLMNFLVNELPIESDRDTWNIAQMTGKELRKAMKMAGIRSWTGLLRASTFPTKLKKGHYIIPLTGYALPLSRSGEKGHFAPIGGGPLRQWWDEKKKTSVPSALKHGAPEHKPGYLYVVSHPFIDPAMEAVRQRIYGEIENGRVIKRIRRGGR